MSQVVAEGLTSTKDHGVVDSQIAALSAAILQPSPVAPSAAVGGQVVTPKIEFGRKEQRCCEWSWSWMGTNMRFSLLHRVRNDG